MTNALVSRSQTVAWVLYGLLAACGDKGGSSATPPHDAGNADVTPPPVDAGHDATTTPDATTDAATDAGFGACDSALPGSLDCTGLYADIASKTIAQGVQAFAPAIPFWADGSGKNRWILLPPGQTIDRSSPNDWVFPAGTKLWKEFSRGGQRIETRFFHKQSDGTWVWVAYVWDAQETVGTAAPSGQVVALEDGATYDVPSQKQCSQCHNGRVDPVMGFEEVSLGTPGASGLTLAALASAALLTPAPTRTSLTIGDDGSGDAAHALGWLHINCGVSCHNANPAASAGSLGMLLRLDAALLDGRSPAGFDPLVTTVGIPSTTGFWGTDDRIQPGDPDDSLIIYLTSNRGGGMQMPPLASVLVDTPDVQILRDWISKMPPIVDGGAPGDAGGADGAAPNDGGDGG